MVLVFANEARANPNIAILMANSPNYTKFLLLNLVSKYPTIGDPPMTAIEYILKI